MRCSRSLFAVMILLVFLLSDSAVGAKIESCGDIRSYFSKPLPSDPYARKEDLGHAVELLVKGSGLTPESCGDQWLMERALFEYATALDEFSKSRSDNETRRTWSDTAVKAYMQHLDWFLYLPEANRDQVLKTIYRNQIGSDSEFSRNRNRWLRLRGGNVLHSMGACLERIRDDKRLFATYGKYSQQCLEAFPNEVATLWHARLKAMSDCGPVKGDAEMKELIAQNDDCRCQWGEFSQFLESYVRLNPSVAYYWNPIKKRIERWFAD